MYIDILKNLKITLAKSESSIQDGEEEDFKNINFIKVKILYEILNSNFLLEMKAGGNGVKIFLFFSIWSVLDMHIL